MRRDVLFAVVLSGCGLYGGGIASADLALEDVNVNSVSYGEVVRVDDFDGQVSLWYFGHAT